jgi:DNA polymerase elongation subunit (family B)
MSEFVFELTKIDPYSCSVEELENEIKRLKDIKEEYFNLEQSIKIFINSVYGACASPFFVGYNIHVAEAVTLQGQDLIKYANTVLDDYFTNQWHLDTELHKELGITYANKIKEKSVVVYNDTDSTYITFDPLLKSCDAPTDRNKIIDFILKIKDFRLNKYLSEKFGEYAEERNTEDLQNLELEKIAYSALMLAKKKYILDIAWKDPGVLFDPQQKISPTGVEIVQGSTPKFARKVLKEMLNVIFSSGKELEYGDVVKKLREYKEQFILQEPDDISKTVSIGDYEKYVKEDRKTIVLQDKCPINVRAASIYNHKLFNTKWKSKYNLIKTGDKIKHYYAQGEHDVFGFLPGDYPYEFAPQVDYDRQFEKVIVEPFNRFIEPLGFNPIPGNLIYAKSLF